MSNETNGDSSNKDSADGSAVSDPAVPSPDEESVISERPEPEESDMSGQTLGSSKNIAKPHGKRKDPIKAPLWVGLTGALILFVVGSVKPFIPHAEEGSALAFWYEMLPLFFAELGVAAIVAYIIAWGIDEQAKRREERAQEEREELERQRLELEKQELLDRERRMTQDVFRGVLGIQHSSAYVQKVIESTLDRKIIRRHVTIMYKLTRLTPEEASSLGVDASKFIFLDQAVSFEFENLSSEAQSFEVKFAVPVRHGAKLREASGVFSALIGGKAQSLEGAIQGDAFGDAKVYIWKKRIEARGRLPVAVKARVIKEDSDSEVWSSYFPCTEGMSLQVTAPTDLHMGLRNNTASHELEEMPQGTNGMAVWKINGPILPNNSVVFYWRTREHEGEASVPPAPASKSPRERRRNGDRLDAG